MNVHGDWLFFFCFFFSFRMFDCRSSESEHIDPSARLTVMLPQILTENDRYVTENIPELSSV